MTLSAEARERLRTSRRREVAVPLKLDAFENYRRLLERPELHFDEERGCWLAAHYADVRQILLDPHTFSSQRTLAADGQVDEVAGGSIIGLDPPRHPHLSLLFAEAFTHRRVASLEPRIREITAALLDRIRGLDGVDIVEALAFPLPVTVIGELLGVPPADRALFRGWATDLLSADLALRMQTFGRFAAYFDELVCRRRSDPQDDLITGLLLAQIDGQRLTARDVTRDTEFGGSRLREGDVVLPLFAAANLDPVEFPDPDRFDPRRSPNRHFGFGHGIHLCLGASLGRLEATLALSDLLKRFPGIRRDRSAALELRPSPFVYSLKSFRVELGQRRCDGPESCHHPPPRAT